MKNQDMIKCPVCGIEIDASETPDVVIHPDIKLKTADEICEFSRADFSLWQWLQIIRAFEQLSRINANAGLPEHLKDKSHD